MTKTRTRIAAAILVLLGALAAVAMTGPSADAHHTFSCNINSPTINTSWGCAKFVQYSSSSGYGYVQDRQTDGACVKAYINRSGGTGQIWEQRATSCNTSPVYFTWSGNPSASPQYRICRWSTSCSTAG